MTTTSPLPRTSFRWLTHCLLAGSLVAASVSMAPAQDFGAVAKRLAESVKHGEITKDQARVMLDALNRASQDHQRAGKSLGGDQTIAEQLKAAVAAGKLTEEQAKAKWNALSKRLVKQGEQKKDGDGKHGDSKRSDAKKGGGLPDAELETIAGQLKAAVAAGKLTEEQAKAKWNALTKRLGKQGETKKDGDGKQGDGKHDKTKNKDAKKGGGLPDAELETIAGQLKAAVAAGKLTEEQAKAKWNALTKRLGKQGEQKKDSDGKQGDGKQGDGKQGDSKRGDTKLSDTKLSDTRLEAIAQQLKAAVKAGKLTEEQAKAKWDALTKEK